jgi:hypothetical protein
MKPLRTDADHKLRFLGKSPGFLEKQVNAPLRRMPFEERRDACLKFQAVLNRRNLNRDSGAETRSVARETLRGSASNFDNGRWLFIDRLLVDGLIERLSESISEAETQTRYRQRSCRAQN